MRKKWDLSDEDILFVAGKLQNVISSLNGLRQKCNYLGKSCIATQFIWSVEWLQTIVEYRYLFLYIYCNNVSIIFHK